MTRQTSDRLGERAKGRIQIHDREKDKKDDAEIEGSQIDIDRYRCIC